MTEQNCHDYCEFGKTCPIPHGDFFDEDNCREQYERETGCRGKCDQSGHCLCDCVKEGNDPERCVQREILSDIKWEEKA